MLTAARAIPRFGRFGDSIGVIIHPSVNAVCKRLIDVLNSDDLYLLFELVRDRFEIVAGNNADFEAEPRRLFYALLTVADGAYLAAEPYLAEGEDIIP